ncbi:MAG: peptide deformylase [Myxococcales bacterium]|nr:peptide deformylase [Myxococcales bacterium]
MALLPIVKFPDPFLRQPTSDVTDFDDALRRFAEDMTETMYASKGAGLAANQVGVAKRMFIVEAAAAGLAENDPPVVFINPVFLWLSDEKETTDEGCLSFPNVFVPIKRSLRARVRAQDAHGNEFVAEGEGLYARAMQHEHDHLINKLLIDYVGPIKRKLIKRKLEREAEADAAEAAADAE